MPKNPYYDDIDLPMHLDVGYHISEEADHSLLYNRDKEDQHPISAITGLEERLEEIEYSGSKLPAGGKKDQVLAKNSDEDFDLVWKDVKGGSGDEDYAGYFDEIKKLGAYRYETFYHVLDYRHAYEYYETTRDVPRPCGCSSVKNGNFYGRSFDWYYDGTAEFVVHTPRIANRYASVGTSPGFASILTEEFVESGKYSDYYRLVPFNLVDGMNEYGLVCNTNVVPTDFGPSRVVPTKESEVTINGMMVVRYLLDHFKTAKEAAEFVQEHMTIYFSKDIHEANYELHLMVADANESYVVEFIGRRTVIFKGQNKMTNFYIHAVDFNEDGTVYTPETQDGEHDAISTNRITKNGSGLERYNLIVNNYDSANTAEGMRNLLNQLTYTRAYKSSKNPSDPYWFTEFVGVQGLTCASEPEEFEYVVDKADQYYRNRERGDHKTWHTVHSTVFDIADRTMTTIFQEGNKVVKFEIDGYGTVEVDNQSIILDGRDRIALNGFEAAEVGQIPTKGESTINWIDPDRALTKEEIEEVLKNKVVE